MTNEVDVVRESAMADAYALLAMLVEHPTLQVAAGLASGALQRDAEAVAQEAGMGSAWEDAVASYAHLCEGANDAEELLRAMRVEHTRLFEHPVRPVIPIHEGQFLYDSSLNASSKAAEASAASASAGQGRSQGQSQGRHGKSLHKEDFFDERPRMFVNPAALDAERCYRAAGLKRADAKNIPGDNMVTELQFMSKLHERRAQALIANDENAFAAASASIEEFERIHLRKWGEAFFQKTEQEARIDAYRLAGTLGASFIAWRLS